MNKALLIFISLILTVSLCSCGNDKTDKVKQTGEQPSVSSQTVADNKPDFDLSALNTTMAYSQVVDISNNISKYEGKTVKIKGTFLVEETEQRNYYACHIADATACCSAGFEFRLKDTSKSYPADYPKANSEITVMGRLSTYKEGENQYIELIDAEFL